MGWLTPKQGPNPSKPPKSPRKSPFSTLISPFVFPNLGVGKQIWERFPKKNGIFFITSLRIDRFQEAFTQRHKRVCHPQKIYPRSPKILHGYIRHIRDIFQLWLQVSCRHCYISNHSLFNTSSTSNYCHIIILG